MKRAGVFLLFAFLIVLSLLLLQGPEGNAPQFLPVQALPTGITYHAFAYEPLLDSNPVIGDKLWIMAGKKGGHDWFLYDLKAGKIQGQLIDGRPLIMTRDQSHVLCSRPFPSRTLAFRDRLTRRIETLTSGRLRFHHPQSYPERYWLLDLEKNTAEKIGDIPMQPEFCFLSPEGRHAYTTRIDIAQRGRRHVFCLDLERRTLRRLGITGWPSGWWDDDRIVVLEDNNDFVLHNLTTGKNSALFSSSQIKDFLQTNGITADLADIRAFASWNGHGNDFYLADGILRSFGWETFLIKVERSTEQLKLISPRFKFGWLDQFDSSGNLYLYCGHNPAQGSDAVFLRNLQTGQDQTLVPSSGAESMSIPRFYRDSAIYLRSNAIWKINLDGTHNMRLFPP